MKLLKYVLVIIPILIITVVILPWFVCPALNDIKAHALSQELKNKPLPKSTTIIETLSGSGNTSGTGNHTEVWAGILIKTELSEDEIHRFYSKEVKKVTASEKSTFIMLLLGKEFSKLRGASEYDGYYIIEKVESPVSSFFDIRGR